MRLKNWLDSTLTKIKQFKHANYNSWWIQNADNIGQSIYNNVLQAKSYFDSVERWLLIFNYYKVYILSFIFLSLSQIQPIVFIQSRYNWFESKQILWW